MRGKWAIGLAVPLGLLSLVAIAAVAQQQGNDPVAEAARKAREQKKNEAKPKKVYTDDDISTHRATTDTATSASTPASGEKANAQPAEGTAQGNTAAASSEADWRKRFQEQRDKIATAEKELSVLQRELDQSQVQYYPDPQKALMQQNNREDINKKSAKIDEKKQEIARLKAGLDDLEVQLRKSGGDPGWAR